MKLLRTMIGIVVLAAATIAAATTVIPMSVEELTVASEHIVQARATQQWSEWAPNHNLILTFTRFQVINTLKGGVPATFVVKQLGGVVDGQRTRVSGVRYFHTNEETVLFMHPAIAKDSTYVITGLMQGNFHVERSGAQATVSNGVAGAHAFSTASHSVSDFGGSRMSLDELQTRVRQAVKR